MTEKQLLEKYKSKEISLENFLEEIIEGGNCPALINDDAGHWAISEIGMQNISLEDEPTDLSTSFFIEAIDLKTTIREAVIHFYTINLDK